MDMSLLGVQWTPFRRPKASYRHSAVCLFIFYLLTPLKYTLQFSLTFPSREANLEFYQYLKDNCLKIKREKGKELSIEERRGEGKMLGIDPSVLSNDKEFSKDYSSKEKMQRDLWDRYIGEHRGLNIELLKTKELQHLVYSGVPDCYRGN